ncbi:MAG: hypothetical protein UDG86_05600 [Lachnospiraceae bacterium]|nr:hypothetical protein [Lachnospiraceae bacterium]
MTIIKRILHAGFSACGGAAPAAISHSAAVRSRPEGFLYHRIRVSKGQ